MRWVAGSRRGPGAVPPVATLASRPSAGNTPPTMSNRYDSIAAYPWVRCLAGR
ncbi:hypothetical protein ACIHFD_61660 [Nonomuraea sp. NPDC051941]|uniref:hypothetical protein n=1 Tax=Nonomuraea sp. NPDC051941 TaxID=3364373 RepID=UPI0037C5C852